jgi:hypothetical protein
VRVVARRRRTVTRASCNDSASCPARVRIGSAQSGEQRGGDLTGGAADRVAELNVGGPPNAGALSPCGSARPRENFEARDGTSPKRCCKS